MRLFRRWLGVRSYGDCPECGHDWREHPGLAVASGEACSECRYETDHDQVPEGRNDECRRPAPAAPASRWSLPIRPRLGV